MGVQYQSLWGDLPQIALPSYLVQDRALTLGPCALAILVVMLDRAKRQLKGHKRLDDFDQTAPVTAVVGVKALIGRTGYSANAITAGLRELESNHLIHREARRADHQEYAVNEYRFLNPAKLQPLRNSDSLNFLYGNRVPYFNLPRCLVGEPSERWSLANLSGSELRLYVAIAFLANERRGHTFETDKPELRKVAALSPQTVVKALNGLEEKGLVWVRGQEPMTVSLCDPRTGEPLRTPDGDEESDPANYHTTNLKGVAKPFNPNDISPEQAEKLILSCLKDRDNVIRQGNGDITICCPFHDDSTPSCSFSPRKRCFNCFGCRETGGLIKLVSRLRNVDTPGALKTIAEAKGQTVEFQQPDSNATAIYSYRDSFGHLLKQVLRYPNDDAGNKVIRQRRPKSGGWKWDVSGLPSMLYREEQFHHSLIVVICEGEKDCDRINALQLSGMVIATTTGGAHTWHSSLAAKLKDKLVIVLPDDDGPGAEYGAAIVKSLEAANIMYRMASFAGTGCKDASEYIGLYGPKAFAELLGTDWVGMPELNERRTEDDG